MPFKFNPFSGNFDQTGSGGGGGGSAFFAGEVATYADLPLDGTAPLDSRWLVRSNSGTWPFSTYKQAGVYVRSDTVGANRDDDYTLTDTSFHDVMSDDAFVLFDEGDATKNLKFQLSGITTGTTRTITMPDANVTLPDQGTSTTDNVTFNEVTTDNNLTVGGDLTITNALVVGTNGVVFENAPSEVTALTTLATDSRAVSLPDASGTIALTSDFAAPPAIGNTTPNTGAFTTLAANNGTLTASAPVLDLSQTWKDAAVAFRGVNWSFVETAAGSGSEVFRISTGVAGTNPIFNIRRDGNATFANGVNVGVVGGSVRIAGQADSWRVGATGFFGFTNLSGNAYAPNDVTLFRDAAATLALRDGFNPQTFRLYTTYGGTGGADFERLFIKGQTGGAFQIGTEAGGTGSARALEIRTDNVARINVSATGGLGFFGAAAVAQPAAIADATDAATTQARLNDLLAAVRSLGLIAT